jgi:hypothetical protein
VRVEVAGSAPVSVKALKEWGVQTASEKGRERTRKDDVSAVASVTLIIRAEAQELVE